MPKRFNFVMMKKLAAFFGTRIFCSHIPNGSISHNVVAMMMHVVLKHMLGVIYLQKIIEVALRATKLLEFGYVDGHDS